MSALALVVAVAALAVFFAGYYYSIRRLFDLPLDGIELHPIYTADGWRILLYRHRRGESNGEPVLLCHGFSANHWNLTAPRGVSLADYLADRGYDCWAIDLRGTRSSGPPPGTPRHRATFDGYVMQDLPAAIEYIAKVTGHAKVHWIGHSLGGTLLYAYELAHGRGVVASGVTMASPPGLHQFWPKDRSRLIQVLETFPGAFAVGQRAIAPIHALVKPRTRLVPVNWGNLGPRFRVAEFFSLAETPPGPITRTLDEWARHQYLAVDNDRVNVLSGLNRLETPLLVFSCPLDPIVLAADVRDFFDRLPSADKRYVELSRAAGCDADYDHIDPPFARNAEPEVFAPIADWLSAHPADAVGTAERMLARPAPREDTPATPGPVHHEVATGGHEPATATGRDDPNGASLWGRALKDAAGILDGLDEIPPVPGPETPASARTRKRRSSRPAAKSSKAKTAGRRRATTSKSSTKKPAAKSKDRKPGDAAGGRNDARKGAKAAASELTTDTKKSKKKRHKSKGKSEKKKKNGKKFRK
jgi:pimeloyl-ACP methyl ester carboxylesterase